MGTIGKGKTLVSVSLPDEWRKEIDKRAAALRMTRAAYVRLMVENWWKAGCQPLNEPDKFMQIARKSK